jgi:hypothetical protein
MEKRNEAGLTFAEERRRQMDQSQLIGYRDGWRAAVLAARDGMRLVPSDKGNGDGVTVHHFAAEIVVKSVEAGARKAGVRFSD